MFTACKGKAAGGRLPPCGAGWSPAKAPSMAQRCPGATVPAEPGRDGGWPQACTWDSSGETLTRGGTGKEENGVPYVGLMILLHVHVRPAAVPDVVQGEELPREPRQRSPRLGLPGRTATEGP